MTYILLTYFISKVIQWLSKILMSCSLSIFCSAADNLFYNNLFKSCENFFQTFDKDRKNFFKSFYLGLENFFIKKQIYKNKSQFYNKNLFQLDQVIYKLK